VKVSRPFLILASLLQLFLADPLAAQPVYPDKPIHMIVGFPPGSQPDIVARLLSHELAAAMRSPVVVDNVTGASGTIAAERLAKATPDGYTVGLLSQTHVVISPILHKVAYDPLRDFSPVSQISVSPNLLVVATTVPANSVAQLVELAKRRPGQLTFASSGNGSGTHMAAELFRSAAGIDIRHIPYRGVVAAVPDLLAGRVTMMFSPLPVVLPQVRLGQLRALAVTSLRRSEAMPELPTLAEAGYPGFEATNWYGLLAPAGAPASVVTRLHVEVIKALQLPELRRKLTDLGIEVVGNGPDEFTSVIRTDIPRWTKLIKDAAIKED